MMQVVPKWKVSVELSPSKVIVIYISENHLANVLQTLSTLSFAETSQQQPSKITVEL